MASKKYYWLKLKNDFFNQREVKKLRRVAGGDTYVLIYLKMQLLSIKNEGVITFERTEDHLDEQLSLELDEDLENVRMTLSFLHANALIEPITNDDFLLNKVPAMIGSETGSAERVRRLRNKEKELLALHCNSGVTESNAEVTKSNTEIELELEIEKELNIEIEKEKPKRKRFIAPTIQDVTAYCIERNNTIDPQSFIDHYEANGWMRGKNKIKDWKACVRTWERNRNDNSKSDFKKQVEIMGDW